MKQCLYCKGKLERIERGFNRGQLICTGCKAIFEQGKNKKENYECN